MGKFSTVQIARICHQANKAYCESLGDFSQQTWEYAPDWQRNSAIQGVEFHSGGYNTPEESHENWMALKIAEGWKYGPVKNAGTKEHPCLVPYAELPVEQKVKDELFQAICNVLLYKNL